MLNHDDQGYNDKEKLHRRKTRMHGMGVRNKPKTIRNCKSLEEKAKFNTASVG